MIKITSFYPFQNFLRVTHEFHDDKVLVKTNSLKFDQEFEFEYKDVVEISDSFHTNNEQANFGFRLLLFSAFMLALFHILLYSTRIFLLIGQILYLSGVILYVTSFRKSWWFYFSDSNSNTISSIKQTRQNRDLIPQVLEIIKNKSNHTDEISVIKPFLNEQEVFEHIAYNYSSLLKTTDKFYKNEIIGLQKSIFEESVYRVKYNQLSGKIEHGKLGIQLWGWSLTFLTLIIVLIGGFYFGFGVTLGITISHSYLYIMYALLALFLISLPISLIKRNVVGFYNKNGKIAYWTHVNKTDKEKFEKIIEFIQSKIPIEEK